MRHLNLKRFGYITQTADINIKNVEGQIRRAYAQIHEKHEAVKLLTALGLHEYK